MNRTILTHYIVEEAGVTKKEADMVLESFILNITAALKKRNKVTLKGFGSWSVVHKNARTGINPSTGQSIFVAAKNVVRFAPSNLLNRNMNDSYEHRFPRPFTIVGSYTSTCRTTFKRKYRFIVSGHITMRVSEIYPV